MAKLKVLWCRVMHRNIAYGGGDVYWCRKCLSRFPVPWILARRPPGPIVASAGSSARSFGGDFQTVGRRSAVGVLPALPLDKASAA